MSNTANRVIKNTGFLYAKMGITMFVSLYTTRLILNSLGASDFGIFTIVGGAISMLGFLNASMAIATQRFMSYAEGENNYDKQLSIFNISIILHTVISLIVGVVLLIAGLFFFNGILNIPYDRVFAAQVIYGSLILSTMFTVMTVPYDAVMNAHENMRYYAIVGVLESMLKLIVAFFCVYTTFDKLIVYGCLMACIPFITLTIMRIYCHKHYQECIIAPKKYWNHCLMKDMTSFAGWNFLTSFTSMVSQYGLSIVLNHFWGAILNTAQGIANQVSGQLMVFSNTMLKALNPVITKSTGSGNNDVMLHATLMGSKYSYILLLVFALPFLIETPYILKLWLDEVPEWTVLFCRLQLLRNLSEQLTITLGSAIGAQGKIKGYSIINSVLFILPIILTSIFFYFEYPPYVMYIIWIFCWSILKGLSSLFYAHRLCNLSLREYIRDVLQPCLVLSVLLFIIGILPHIVLDESFYRLILIILLIIIFLPLLGWLYIFSSEEKNFLTNSILNLKKIKK